MHDDSHNWGLRLNFKPNPLKNRRLLTMLMFSLGGVALSLMIAVSLDSPSLEKYIALGIFLLLFLFMGLFLLLFEQTILVYRGSIVTITRIWGIPIRRHFTGSSVFLKETEVNNSKTGKAGAEPMFFYDFRVSENIDCKILPADEDIFEESRVFVGNATRVFLRIPKNAILKIAEIFETPEVYAQKKHFRTDNPRGVFNEKYNLEP